MAKEIKKVVLYARVSSKEQEKEGFSIPAQFELLGATESEGKGFSCGLWKSESKIAQPLVHNKRAYKRLFIRKRVVK